MSKIGLTFGFVLFFATLVQPVHAQTEVSCSSAVPLPSDLNITPATSEVSPQLAKFVGTWCGRFPTGRDMIVVIENINPTGRAQVIYAIAKGGRFNAINHRVIGSVDDGALRFSLPNNAELVYEAINENKIAGTLRRSDRSFSMTLSRGVISQAESVWTAWARVDGRGRQPFYYGRGKSADGAERSAIELCQQRSGRQCSFVSYSAGRCSVLRLASGTEMKPRDC